MKKGVLPVAGALCIVLIGLLFFIRLAQKQAHAKGSNPRDARTKSTGSPQPKEPELTAHEKELVARAVKQVEEHLRAAERANTETVFTEDLPTTSTVIVRISEPTADQFGEFAKLVAATEANFAGQPQLDSAFTKGIQKLKDDYIAYPPGWPVKVVFLKTNDPGTAEMGTWSMVGYFRDAASATPDATGRITFPEGSRVSQNIWDQSSSWAKQRYGYLFQFEAAEPEK
jgi:hypothetical protein